MNGRLQIDRLTLSDLEVFPGGADGRGLFELLDRTRTRGGRVALRERLTMPFSDAGAILSVQEALRFLQGHVAVCRAVLESPSLGAVEQYLASRYVGLQPREGFWGSAAARWTALRYPDLLVEAERGTREVRSLVEHVLEFCSLMVVKGAPTGLGDVIRQLQLAGDDLSAAMQKSRDHRSPIAVLSLDGVLRGALRPQVERCLKGLYRLDALLGLAEAAQELHWVFPEIVDDHSGVMLRVAGLYHPLLHEPVANDILFDPESPVMFLTGPNMAGKTTLMRAAGLAVYLAQLGMGVPAQSMRIAPFASVISGMSEVDSARLGCSHFLSEIRRLRHGAEALATGERTLLLFDEIFRGTNFHDALEASYAVIEAFAKCHNGATVISSHAAELLPRIQGLAGVRLNHFDMAVADGVPHYSYRLEAGAYSGRMAMVLLGQEKLLDALQRLSVLRA